MVASMSFVQTALADVLREEIDDVEQALRASIAWNKMLMLQLDILLAGYVNETPTETAPDPLRRSRKTRRPAES